MKTKNERIKAIKRILKTQDNPVSISFVYLTYKRVGNKISRKTIERDMLDLIEDKSIKQIEGLPLKFVLNRPTQLEFVFELVEVEEIIKYLPHDSILRMKLLKEIE